MAEAEKIKVRDRWTIRLHWFNALCWALLVPTGLGIISGESLRLAPAWWPQFLQTLFGGNQNLILFHVVLGVVWMVGIGLFILLRWRSVVVPFLRNVMVLTPGALWRDLRTLVITMARLFGLMKRVPIPPQGRYNGAQRLLGTMIVFASLAIAFSGLYLYFGPMVFHFPDSALYGAAFRWALVVHAAAVFLVLIGLVPHIYFAIVEERESLETMKSGYAEVDFIKHHNPLWYEELKREGKLR
ncbi:formate dehydrogenase subunit gamma [Alkalispirillum mobile]|uniref:Formate dehydrogenase subunit gamma n=1 Tax=Alkalispirillum mobile TaxID=85925 RepID=A0A498C4G9_9GAMM|nr:cytochrome b/b6 domain-containing protein [Alkalispirillum mobile]RLK51074.1 formate dehydrogenase subunit gamma [Alkalispirillum mobile]